MTNLKCSDYGFECNFVVSGEPKKVAKQFGQHYDSVHGIEYTFEAIEQIILRKS